MFTSRRFLHTCGVRVGMSKNYEPFCWPKDQERQDRNKVLLYIPKWHLPSVTLVKHLVIFYDKDWLKQTRMLPLKYHYSVVYLSSNIPRILPSQFQVVIKGKNLHMWSYIHNITLVINTCYLPNFRCKSSKGESLCPMEVNHLLCSLFTSILSCKFQFWLLSQKHSNQ